MSRLRRWVREGPSPAPEEDGTLGWMLGMLLWWRVLASGLLFAVGLAGVLVIAALVESPFLVAMLAFFVGLFVGERALRISPKYEVSKNY